MGISERDMCLLDEVDSFFRYNLRRYDLIYNSNCKYYIIVREKYRYRAKN